MDSHSPAYPPGGYNQVRSTLHWGPDATHNRFSYTQGQASGYFADEFHTNRLIWNESYIATYIDSKKTRLFQLILRKCLSGSEEGSMAGLIHGEGETIALHLIAHYTISLTLQSVGREDTSRILAQMIRNHG